VLTLPGDYWQLRGTTNWKWPGQNVYENIKKYLVPVDSQEKYPWERTAELDETYIRRRDWFFDFKLLLDLGLITESQFDAIYNKEKDPGPLYVDRAFDQIVRHEDLHQRLSSKYALSKGTISSGTYSIGSGLNYSTITAFEADIIDPGTGPLTGNLTGEHNNEETSISTDVTFDVKTGGYLFKLTAQSGDEHNGGAYGNGARIKYGTYDSLTFYESIDEAMDNIEISKLAIDISGTGNDGLIVSKAAQTDMCFINRLLIKGANDSDTGIKISNVEYLKIINCIIYEADEYGINFNNQTPVNWLIANNTVVKGNVGIRQDAPAMSGTVVIKNNLCQGNTTGYADDGGGFGTHSHNVSEDATSPDASYQSKDLHTNSIFKNYASDDYRLDSGGNATNLAIVDDGEDLSGTFTDDIQGQTRSTWYIGASEIVAGGATYQAEASDGMQLGEALARKATFPVSITDGLSTGDTPSKIATLLSQASDGAVLSDTSSVIATLLIAITDGSVISDTPTRRADFKASSSDGLTLNETLTVTALFIALSQDGATFGDTAAWQSAIQALATDGLIGGDSLHTLLTALATAADGVTLSESLARQLTTVVAATDGITLGDTGTLQATFRVQATDGATFSDVVSRIVTFAALATDGFTLSDITVHLLATGEVSITFTTKKAAIEFVVTAPGMAFTSKKPEITFH